MKNKLVVLLALGVASTCFVAHAKADADSIARAELSQVYRVVNAGASRESKTACAFILNFNAPRNVRFGIAENQVTTARIHGRYGVLLMWRAAYDHAQSININTSIQRFKLENNRATVVIKDYATIVHRDAETEETKSEVIITLATETWVKNKGSWKLLRSYTLASKQMPSQTLT